MFRFFFSATCPAVLCAFGFESMSFVFIVLESLACLPVTIDFQEMAKALKSVCSLRSDWPTASHGWASTEGLDCHVYLLTSEVGDCPLS